jgi:predicted Zn-dependent protease
VSYFQRGNKATDKDSINAFYDKSIDAFTTATKLEPDSADTFKNLAFVYMSSGKNEEAIEPLKKLVQLTNELDGYKYLGQIYYSLGTKKKADYKSSGNIQDSIDANKEFASAVNILEKGTKLYRGDADLLRTLSASYVETGNLDIALNSFKELVDKEPDNKVYLYNYGVLLLGNDQYEKAVDEFDKALKIDPDYENAIYNLAVTYVKWGTQMNKESEASEEYSDAYKEKFKAALPYLERITQTDKADAEVWELLGKVYSVLGMQDKALDAFNHADQLR